MASLGLGYGYSNASCLYYVYFAMIGRSPFGNYKDAFRFGRLGYELVERGLRTYQARTYMLFGSVVIPWAKHALDGRHLVRRALDAAYRNGDLTFAGHSCNQLITNFLALADPLSEARPEADNGRPYAPKA